MRQPLKLHPHSPCAAARQIEVDIARPRPGVLALRYVIAGNMRDLRMAPATAPTRSDGLWRHSCFEAFIRAETGEVYYEFNFAPSTQWAAYRFGGYRNGMRVAAEFSAPRIEVQESAARYELQVSLDLEHLPDLPRDAPWRLGLSAVIEDMSGRLSYWALAHPLGKPDFHHADCFALELPAA